MSLLASLPACGHKVESPALDISDETPLSPDLVCNAQLVTPVVVEGKGFRPAPTDTLSSPTVLITPEVSLTRTANVGAAAGADAGTDGSADAGADAGADVGDGGAMQGVVAYRDGETIVLSGDPRKVGSDGNADNNTWQSESKMTFVIDEDLAVPEGIYDLTIKNPDGRHEDTKAGALAVVPPPKISKVIMPAICVDQSDQELRLVGSTFLEYDGEKPSVTVAGGGQEHQYPVHTLENCVEIQGRSKTAQRCTDALFTVPMRDLDPGTYTLKLTNPGPANCSSTDEIMVEVNPPPKVESVAPPKVCSGGSILLATGENFQDGAMAALHCGSDTIAAVGTEVSQGGTQLSMTFGPGAAPGVDCDVVVTNPDGCEDRPLPHQSVTGTEGPILFNVAPPVVFNGINTQIKLYVTALEPPFTVSIAPTGTTDSTELKAIIDPANSRRAQATVPAGTPVGEYDVTVADKTECLAVLAKGLKVTDQDTIDVTAVKPEFGYVARSNAVTVFGGAANTFSPTPLVFLSPVGKTNEAAVQLFGVSVSGDGSTLTAVVPADIKAGSYNLVVVDPVKGVVGVLNDAYSATADPPPVIELVTPQSVVNALDGPSGAQSLTAIGTGFSGASVQVRCEGPDGSSQTPNAVGSGTESCDNGTGECKLTVSFDGQGLSEGAVCVVRVMNADGSYGDYSAIGVTGPSLNLADSRAGSKLNTARRGLVAEAVRSTAAARFVYAIGGDTGPADSDKPLGSVEYAPVDIFGNMQAFQDSRHPLPAGRSFAASTHVGRYIYVYGGSDGTNPLASGQRALVLSPEEAPEVSDLDLCLSGSTGDCFDTAGLGAGIPAGTYAYRVAAVIDPADTQNLGGETLAADPISLRLPNVMDRGILVKLLWKAPVDSKGTELTGITGYRIYRTPKGGAAGVDEALIAQVGASETSWIDDGSKSLGGDTPMPPGSTSAWQALPNLNVARAWLRGAHAVDNNDPNTFYLYALLGKDSGSALHSDGSGLASYEYLKVTVLPNGRQSVAASWAAPATGFASARWDHGAWVADSLVSSAVPAGQTWLYVGGGRLGSNNTVVNNTEAARVSDTGELEMFTEADASDPSRTGFGTAAAAGRLFVFGGWPPSMPANDGGSYGLVSPTALDNFNNEGGLSLGTPRYQMGSTLESAFIFIVGGQNSIKKQGGTDNITGGTVTNTTALIVQ